MSITFGSQPALATSVYVFKHIRFTVSGTVDPAALRELADIVAGVVVTYPSSTCRYEDYGGCLDTVGGLFYRDGNPVFALHADKYFDYRTITWHYWDAKTGLFVPNRNINILAPTNTITPRKGFVGQLNYVVSGGKKVVNVSGCIHEWKDYHGFTEKYKYCARCDQKDTSHGI